MSNEGGTVEQLQQAVIAVALGLLVVAGVGIIVVVVWVASWAAAARREDRNRGALKRARETDPMASEWCELCGAPWLGFRADWDTELDLIAYGVSRTYGVGREAHYACSDHQACRGRQVLLAGGSDNDALTAFLGRVD